MYRRVLRSKLSVGISPVYVNETRMAISSAVHTDSEGAMQPPPLRMLLDRHRLAKSPDPRDKVYAFLRLTDRKMAPFRS
jgi:hypothetical protein